MRTWQKLKDIEEVKFVIYSLILAKFNHSDMFHGTYFLPGPVGELKTHRTSLLQSVPLEWLSSVGQFVFIVYRAPLLEYIFQ